MQKGRNSSYVLFAWNERVALEVSIFKQILEPTLAPQKKNPGAATVLK